MFKKILIANRGEIACRVIKTARKMGIATVAVYSDADRDALHVKMADEVAHIGPPPANQSYIVIDKIMNAIRQTGAEAVHPGYGFLSENAKFAEALDAEGVAFIGPPKGAIEAMGDKHGNCIYLNERECSIQRRNQKVVEEAPSPFLDAKTRKAMGEQAVALAKAVDYCSAGAVEFIVDGARNFYFLEMNTRLQVEHPVTELITGVDLVEQMIRVAAGEALSMTQADAPINGWAIESRLYAEDPYRNFLPSIGRLTRYRPPAEGETASGAITRNDTGVEEGGEISIFYDPMIAKLCTWAPDRAQATAAMCEALDGFELEGIGHNLPFLSAVMDHLRFVSGDITTAFIAEEYPDGFTGADLDEATLCKLAAGAAAMRRVSESRDSRISGRLDNHKRVVGADWVVTLDGAHFAVSIDADHEGATVRFDDGGTHRVISNWTPGDTLAALDIDGEPLLVKVEARADGFRLRHRGCDLEASVRSPRAAELAAHIIEKTPPDTSKMLLCPMPGTVVAIHVSEGDQVEVGQAVATIEAMKMENTLRAERRATVASINAAPGESLPVDHVIALFE